MRRPRPATRIGFAAGCLGLLLAGMLGLADPGGAARNLREAVFDRILAWSPREAAATPALIVDIDREALSAFGPWPWPRDLLARLVQRIADAGPKVLAIDILLPARDDESGDDALAAALTRIPAVLALVLDPDSGTDTGYPSAVASSGPVEIPDLLLTPGILGPAPKLAASAHGLGVISLPARDGEPVRAVPLLASGGGALFAGLSLEALRAAAGGVTLIASAPPQMLRAGDIALPLPPDGLMRLHFSARENRKARIIPASAVLSGTVPPSRLAGKIVFLGASAPEAGGLRLTAVDPFMPSVEIEAEAFDQMLSGHVPLRSKFMDTSEIAIGIVLGLIGIVAVIFLPPAYAMFAAAGLLLAWIGAAILLSLGTLWLTDPATPAIVAFFGIQAANLAEFGITYRQRLAIERRFALHLPPEVVRRIVDNPSEIKLAGDSRVITALFTDIEGFTALTERTDPELLLSLLDRYMETVASLIVEHGGMVDKFVGDAVHAFFNAPVDLPNHAEKAVACAIAILGATEALRRDPRAAATGFGRTRIGIETGLAMLGEVGRGTKRDYTAYGRAVNLASRLESLNKRFGSSIAIGPGTAALTGDRMALRPLGSVALDGFEEKIDVFTPEIAPPHSVIPAKAGTQLST